MGYDLIPRNKELDDFHFGAFSWSWFILDEGAGLVLGYTMGHVRSAYLYNTKKRGGDLMCNDGARVTSLESRMLAQCAASIVMKYTEINKINKDKTEHDFRNYGYIRPVREDFIQKLKDFYEWALKSKGFKVI